MPVFLVASLLAVNLVADVMLVFYWSHLCCYRKWVSVTKKSPTTVEIDASEKVSQLEITGFSYRI